MKTFDFLFGAIQGEMLFRHSDNLSKTLQKKSISAAEGQQVGRMVIDTLCSLRTDDSYDLFWTKVGTVAKIPRRFDDGLSSGDFHDTPKAYYHQLYYEAIDNIVACL